MGRILHAVQGAVAQRRVVVQRLCLWGPHRGWPREGFACNMLILNRYLARTWRHLGDLERQVRTLSEVRLRYRQVRRRDRKSAEGLRSPASLGPARIPSGAATRDRCPSPEHRSGPGPAANLSRHFRTCGVSTQKGKDFYEIFVCSTGGMSSIILSIFRT